MSIKAIAVVDMTNDFVWEEYEIRNGYKEKGKLVAPLGKTVIDPIARLLNQNKGNAILYLEDEHTKESEEIKSGNWPEHCMKGTPGAETVDILKRTEENVYNIKKDTYNAFTNPELDRLLKEKGIAEVYIVGLVQEICIKQNAEGFLDNGYKVNIVIDATAPFNAYNGYLALKKLEEKGARMIDLETALKEV